MKTAVAVATAIVSQRECMKYVASLRSGADKSRRNEVQQITYFEFIPEVYY